MFRPKLINYTSTSVAEGGVSAPPYYSSAYTNMTTLAGTGLTLGDMWVLEGGAGGQPVPGFSGGGNAFLVVKANAALSKGQLVTYDDPFTSGTISTGSTSQVAVLSAAVLTAGAEIGNFIYINNATTQYIRQIKDNTTTTVTVSLRDPNVSANTPDADIFTPTLPANTDPYTIIRPWNVKVCVAATRPVGVALGTVTSGNFTIIQVAGLAEVTVLGAATVTANAVLIPAAAGVATGSAAAALASEGVTMIAGSAWTTASNRQLPVLCNFTGAI